jgi:hypothetical protein
MIKVLILPYAAVSVCFLRAYRQKLTVSGVLASLLWPFSLALTLAWLIMLDDDALKRRPARARFSEASWPCTRVVPECSYASVH